MAQTVGQHGVAAFTNPSNGDPLDATVVKANDNSVRGAYVDHDSDGGIHLQSSTLASRPVAGTVGRKWLTTDSGSVKLWFDNGSAWEEISYVPSTGNPSFTDATLNGTTTNAGTISGGTISGGTVAPTTLTVPSGTTIPTHTETGTITAAGSTRNGGTLSGATLSGTTTNSGTISGGTMSGATLNNSTFTGTVTGISANPSVYSASLATNVSLTYNTLATVLSVSVPSSGTYLGIGQVYVGGLGTNLNGGGVGATVYVRETNTTLHGYATAVSALTVTGAYSSTPTITIPVTFVATVASATDFIVTVLAQGNTGSPAVSGSASYDSTVLSLIKIS